jgi:hypothetical protein
MDMKALLAHDDPQGSTYVKGNNAELFERVMTLASVKSAVATYLGSSPTKSQAQPVTQTLTPALPAPSALHGILPAAFESTAALIRG